MSSRTFLSFRTRSRKASSVQLSQVFASAEIERCQPKPTDSLDAYDLYLRALPQMHQIHAGGLPGPTPFYAGRPSIDPNFSDAMGGYWPTASAACECDVGQRLGRLQPRACDAARRAISSIRQRHRVWPLAAWAFAYYGGRARAGA